MTRLTSLAFSGILLAGFTAGCDLLGGSKGGHGGDSEGGAVASPLPSPSLPPVVRASYGPVYAGAYSGIAEVPGDGSPHQVIFPIAPGEPVPLGIVLDRPGRFLYYTLLVDGVGTLMRIDLPLGSSEFVAKAPELGLHPYGLVVDSRNRIYLQGGGTILRYDPAAPLAPLEVVASGLSQFWNLAIDPADGIYGTSYLLSGANDAWIKKVTFLPVPGGAPFPFMKSWAQAPADEATNFVVGGAAFNAMGEAFIMNATGTRLYKYFDLNGDGDALDPGERTVFATLPGGALEVLSFGITAVPGGGILLNRQPYNADTGPLLGIYLLQDLNGDGDAEDEGEQTMAHPDPVHNGLDPGCLTAPR